MSNGIPIRLSAALTESAREVASVLDRSLTDQVEHWARLGQLVEAAVSNDVVTQLKARSYDANIPKLLAYADTAEGKAKAVALIRELNEFRHGSDDAGSVYRVDRAGKKAKVLKRP
jgi:hypothetical protein